MAKDNDAQATTPESSPDQISSANNEMTVPDIHEPTASETNNDDENYEIGSDEDPPAISFADTDNELKSELKKISVDAYKLIDHEESFNPDDFPIYYKENLPKEKTMLQYADNFRRQYVQLYRDRKPLFLNPVNECSIEKFVSTTIRPTLLPFKEFYTWDGCAEFVADYLNFKPLMIPYELPTRLLSPATVLKRQLGNCFEYSTVLASMLIGAGYDAYVVSGYATREICLCDTTRDICNLLKTKKAIVVEEQKNENPKYQVKPPKDLRSKFILKMEARRIAEEEARIEAERLEKERKQLEMEKPPSDSLFGMRIHSWILVLAGKREVPESFFIEPFTGQSQFLDYDGYHGIESIWNHQNYWVNMQDCSQGVKDMAYDLGDCVKWEVMLPGHEKALLQLPEVKNEQPDMLDDEDEEVEVETYFDMPASWVEPIQLTFKDFKTRCPLGKKSRLFKQAKLETFAPYLMPDGLVRRLSTYKDRDLTDQSTSKEFYENRLDKLKLRYHNLITGLITEEFAPGRPRSLKEHTYKASAPEIENDRTMVFYDEARVDGLLKRIETPFSITEHYVNRDDFLYYVHVDFMKRTSRFVAQDNKPYQRGIQKMVQKYHRNPSKIANDDIAEVTFLMSEDRINITYHLEAFQIAASTREFIKPHNWAEKGAMLNYNPDMHSTFQVSLETKPTKGVDQFLMFLDLMRAEEKCRDSIRESEEEVRELLETREKENEASELTISVYDTERNEKAKKHRMELERTLEEMKLRKREMELDYLAPFLAQMNNPEKITRSQAYKLKEDCLNDLKQRLIDRANLIQARFEKETQELQKKQAWYQQNQMSMQKVDEEDYLNYCSDAMFRIHILELRLNRHKEMAPYKYMAMEQKLRNDTRLADFF